MKGFILELKSCCLLSVVHSVQVKMMLLLFIWMLMVSFHTGSSEDLLTPFKEEMTTLEGDTVTLSCNYSGSVASVYWYQQKSSSPPQLLIADYSENTGRRSMRHDKKTKEFHLQISSAAVSDSAVYYCALQPTVTGNTKTLYKNLWSKDNTILHNIHQGETLTVKLQWFVAGSQSPISLMLRRRAVQQTLFSCFILLQWKNTVHLLSDFNNSKDMLLYFFLFLSHFIGLTAGDTISPVEDEVTGREGESVKLTCRYQTAATGVYLYWYKHHSDLEAPQFILMKGAKSWSYSEYIPDNRYESQTSDTSTELTIKSLTLADTALYYCALEITYTLGWDTTFGKAIRLTVIPIDSSPLEPDLFILSPLQPKDWQEESVDDLGPEVCLATGFRPKDGEMVLNVKKGPLTLDTSKAVLSQERKSYFFPGFTNRTIHSCELHNSSANNENLDLCHDLYPEKAKLNFFLVLMNGVRVVFTKALAFNTVLTIRALLF